jgi:hypothetical protein
MVIAALARGSNVGSIDTRCPVHVPATFFAHAGNAPVASDDNPKDPLVTLADNQIEPGAPHYSVAHRPHSMQYRNFVSYGINRTWASGAIRRCKSANCRPMRRSEIHSLYHFVSDCKHARGNDNRKRLGGFDVDR